MSFSVKRIYEAPSPDDGLRVLVDRLWPRGVSKDRAALDAWMKDVAPSTELRTWFKPQPERMDEFTARYLQEIETIPERKQAAAELMDMGSKGKVTLLYASRDLEHDHTKILAQWLNAQTSERMDAHEQKG